VGLSTGLAIANITAGSGYNMRNKGQTPAGTGYSAFEDNLSSGGGSTTASMTVTGNTAGTIGIAAFFSATFNITGNAGVAGATVSYSGPSSGSVVADGSGNYTIPTTVNGVYTITPSSPGQTFSPSSQTVNMVSANVSGVNFTQASAFDILFRGKLYMTRVVSGQ
jgi:hypothetical protein